jgi:fused signal recognition particle receptor
MIGYRILPVFPNTESMLFGNKKRQDSGPGLWRRLRHGLSKTRAGIFGGLAGAFGKGTVDEAVLEEIETRLLLADVGIETTGRLIDGLRQAMRANRLNSGEDAFRVLQEEMRGELERVESPLAVTAGKPFVILVVGVNGAGKTTTIGKLAHRFLGEGLKVLLAAGDTFRAAAIEQIQVWGERNRIPVIAQRQGADAAAVIYDALAAARARDIDVVIADTAGRLHTKSNLMEELKKIRRTIEKLDAAIPVETLLVLDAGTGQNALAQAEQFDRAVGITGIALTKLDGTARGGIVFALAEKLGKPLRFIGVGEQLEDLQPFAAADYVNALLAAEE